MNTPAHPWLIPFLAFAIALGLALAVNALAIALHPRRDSGGLWTRVLVTSGWLLVGLILYAWLLRAFNAAWWDLGYHPLFDEIADKLPENLKTALGSPLLEHLHWVALAIPFVLWLLTLGFALLWPTREGPGQARPGAWLAGAIGFERSRRWVLIGLVPPLAILLLWTIDDLGVGENLQIYRAAVWGTLAVFAITLIAIALSRGRLPVAPADAEVEPAPVAEPEDWVAALRARGFSVERLVRIEPNVSDEDRSAQPRDRTAADLLAQWPLLRERRVPVELVEAVADLFVSDASRRRHGLDRLVLAADDSGQLEALAVAIQLNHYRLKLITLIVVPREPALLAGQLAPWLPADAIHLPRANTPLDNSALVWLVEASALSEHLADLADNPPLLGRIGLVAWWDLDAYSGVMAANFWAVSHRLNRVISRKGYSEVRSLTFARYHQGHEAQQITYTAQLLPYKYRAEDRVVLEQRRWQPIEVHLLEPTAGLKPLDPVTQTRWDPSLIAARTSLEAGWRTRFEPPRALDRVKANDFLQQRLAGVPLAARLARGHADAGARVMEIGVSQLLSLGHLVSQGGRAQAAPGVHHVGLLLPPGNPYVRYLLTLLHDDPEGFFANLRRLVPGEPQPAIVRQHLLLALREMEGVAKELLGTFQWKAAILDEVLDRLADEDLVKRRDVRFLDPNSNQLTVDTGYRSSVEEVRPGPLDTVGEHLVNLIDPKAGTDNEVLLRIDPERASIVGYPGRVFRHQGRTYRVDGWPSNDARDLKRDLRLTCTPIDDPVLTWRVSDARLLQCRRDKRVREVFDDGLNLLVIETRYEEEVTGLIEVRDEVPGTPPGIKVLDQRAPILGQSFPTRGLMLRCLPEEVADDPVALRSVAQALGLVLAVHVGVDEDAVRVVPLEGVRVDRREEWGLVIVDLYPQGIGLIDVLSQDIALPRRLLRLTRDWLAHCACQRDDGCPNCVRAPPAIAGAGDALYPQLSRNGAVVLLNRLLGGSERS